jgi:SAM-dependent methyltransferase
MSIFGHVWSFTRRFRKDVCPDSDGGEPQLIAAGWDQYARAWDPASFKVLPGTEVEHLGDEWTAEDSSAGGTAYGITPNEVIRFSTIVSTEVLDKYIPCPSHEGLEIGPGGGRFTALLLQRVKLLNVADPSAAMLGRLKKRFEGVEALRMYQTDGMTLPPLGLGTLDFVASFDVFVHFEPRLVFWYLRQIKRLLRPGGIGLIHYSNVMSSIGWQQFEMDLERNVKQRTYFASFGVMCPQLMEQFLKALELEVISLNVAIIPRDAIVVFRNTA